LPRYLADSSIWGWANSGRRDDIRAKLAERFERGEVVTSAPIILKVMHRARSGVEYDKTFEQLFGPLDRLPMTDDVVERALELQREMAQTSQGNHLRPAIDFLIAAVAEAAGDDIVLWAFDKDLQLIARHTGQAHDSEQSTGPGR